jgi:hypothetical protein
MVFNLKIKIEKKTIYMIIIKTFMMNMNLIRTCFLLSDDPICGLTTIPSSSPCASYIKSQVLECQLCHRSILSKEHAERCNTVSMWQTKEFIIDETFKPIMTYGLGGCTAFMMVFYDKITNKPYKVVFSRDPSIEEILKVFTRYYSTEYNIAIVIKSPSHYEYVDKKYIKIADDEYFWLSNIKQDNCKLFFEPYSTMINDYDDRYQSESSIYLRMCSDLQYSDAYGLYHSIIYDK